MHCVTRVEWKMSMQHLLSVDNNLNVAEIHFSLYSLLGGRVAEKGCFGSKTNKD